MKQSIKLKLEQMLARFQELELLLSAASMVVDQAQFTELSKEYSQLQPLSACYAAYLASQANAQMLNDCIMGDDQDLIFLATEELEICRKTLADLEATIEWHLLPKDPEDDRSIYLEIRAGAGGDEAAIFAGDLFRMYSRYAESQGWHVEIISLHSGEHGGYKEIVAHVSGHGVFAQLKFESGTHRVQRIPLTESQGRVHTSTCTVAVLPEVEAIAQIQINADELRIDTYRSSGAGGQHVNKTDSAIRITHLPSGLVIECQDERSQHKNRAKAMALLKTKLLDMQQRKQRAEQAQTRKLQVGTGDRSERIRTYNFPQGRLTDHRINLTLYQLDQIMEGYLTPVLDALRKEHYAELLLELGQI